MSSVYTSINDIPEAILKRLQQFVPLQDKERILVYQDKAQFFSGKKGLLFTNRRIIEYKKNRLMNGRLKSSWR